MTPTTDPDTPTPETTGWERWGWLMAVIWLPFLAFSVGGVLQIPGIWRQVTGLALIAIYAGIYTHGFVWRFGERTTRHLVAMAVCVIAMPVLGGLEGLIWIAPAMTPFLISFAWYNVSIRSAILVTTVALVLSVGVTLVEPQAWFFILLNGGISLATAIPRVLDGQQEIQAELMSTAARSSERERMARDIHDILGHSLTVISLKSQLTEKLIATDPEAAASEARQIHDITRKALAEVRSSVDGLRVAWLPDELRSAQDLLTVAGIEANVPQDPTVVEPQNRTVLAWALRESVTNVARHSHAKECTVTLEPHRLIVTDNGRGLKNRGEGNGLRGLRERVEDSGGSLTLTNREDGNGTRVEIVL